MADSRHHDDRKKRDDDRKKKDDERKRRDDERKKRDDERKRRDDERKRRDDERRRKDDDRKRRDDEQTRKDADKKKIEEQKKKEYQHKKDPEPKKPQFRFPFKDRKSPEKSSRTTYGSSSFGHGTQRGYGQSSFTCTSSKDRQLSTSTQAESQSSPSTTYKQSAAAKGEIPHKKSLVPTVKKSTKDAIRKIISSNPEIAEAQTTGASTGPEVAADDIQTSKSGGPEFPAWFTEDVPEGDFQFEYEGALPPSSAIRMNPPPSQIEGMDIHEERHSVTKIEQREDVIISEPELKLPTTVHDQSPEIAIPEERVVDVREAEMKRVDVEPSSTPKQYNAKLKYDLPPPSWSDDTFISDEKQSEEPKCAPEPKDFEEQIENDSITESGEGKVVGSQDDTNQPTPDSDIAQFGSKPSVSYSANPENQLVTEMAKGTQNLTRSWPISSGQMKQPVTQSFRQPDKVNTKTGALNSDAYRVNPKPPLYDKFSKILIYYLDRKQNPITLIKVNEDDERDFDYFIENKKVTIPTGCIEPSVEKEDDAVKQQEMQNPAAGDSEQPDENALERFAAQLVATMPLIDSSQQPQSTDSATDQNLQIMQLHRSLLIQQEQIKVQQVMQEKQQLQLEQQMNLIQQLTMQSQASALNLGSVQLAQTLPNIVNTGSSVGLNVLQQLVASMGATPLQQQLQCTSISDLIGQLTKVLPAADQKSLAEDLMKNTSNTGSSATATGTTSSQQKIGGAQSSGDEVVHVPHDILRPGNLFNIGLSAHPAEAEKCGQSGETSTSQTLYAEDLEARNKESDHKAIEKPTSSQENLFLKEQIKNLRELAERIQRKGNITDSDMEELLKLKDKHQDKRRKRFKNFGRTIMDKFRFTRPKLPTPTIA